MNINFRRTAPLLLLLLAVLACGRFGSSSTFPDDASSKDSPPEIPKEFVNMPSLFGKSKIEMKGLLKTGTLTNDHDDWFDYEFPWGKFTAHFSDSQFDSMAFSLPMAQGSDGPYWLGEKKERLGEMVGIDLTGKVPTAKLDSFTSYEETIDGTEMKITITPTELGKDLFYEIRVAKKD